MFIAFLSFNKSFGHFWSKTSQFKVVYILILKCTNWPHILIKIVTWWNKLHFKDPIYTLLCLKYDYRRFYFFCGKMLWLLKRWSINYSCVLYMAWLIRGNSCHLLIKWTTYTSNLLIGVIGIFFHFLPYWH